MERTVVALALAVTFLPVTAARAGAAPPRDKRSELAEALAAMRVLIDVVEAADVGQSDLAEAPARLQEVMRTGRFQPRDVALISRWVLEAKEETVARGIGDALAAADLKVAGPQGERWNPALNAMTALFQSALRDAAEHRRRDTRDWPELTALVSAAAPAIAASLREADPELRAELQRLLGAAAAAVRAPEPKPQR
jgi:hypothetical protein